MRKLLRSIAHAKMKEEGVCHPNRPRKDLKGRPTCKSYFAQNWRKYVGA